MSTKIPVFIRLILEIILIPPVLIPNGAYDSYSILETLIPCTSQLSVVPEQLRAKSIYKLVGAPMYKIKERAREMGFDRVGHSFVEHLLSNPVYAGLLKVDAYKDMPGGLFPGKQEPIVDLSVWKMVQQKLKRPIKTRTVVDDAIPLRGILKCHCGQPLTGAPSKSRSGKYFYYYKCKHSGQNNISAVKAHEQLDNLLESLSIKKSVIAKIKIACKKSLADEVAVRKTQAEEYAKQLKEVQDNLNIVEENG